MPSDKAIKEKRHRLPLECYRGMIRVSLTFCIKDRKRIFTSKNVNDVILKFLRRAIAKQKAKNWVYVLMPHHMHCVLEGTSDESDLWKAAVLFKQLSGLWLSKNYPAVKWQKDFYDHILRKDEDLQKHIGYVVSDPVRKELVENWDEYPFTGSLDYDLKDLFA